MPVPVSPISKFPCNQCGLCCQRVHQSTETRFLDRGDGVCKHYDVPNKSCSIYELRPEICRVDIQFTNRFAQHYSWHEFVMLNTAVCTALQAEEQQALIYRSGG